MVNIGGPVPVRHVVGDLDSINLEQLSQSISVAFNPGYSRRRTTPPWAMTIFWIGLAVLMVMLVLPPMTAEE